MHVCAQREQYGVRAAELEQGPHASLCLGRGASPGPKQAGRRGLALSRPSPAGVRDPPPDAARAAGPLSGRAHGAEGEGWAASATWVSGCWGALLALGDDFYV